MVALNWGVGPAASVALYMEFSELLSRKMEFVARDFSATPEPVVVEPEAKAMGPPRPQPKRDRQAGEAPDKPKRIDHGAEAEVSVRADPARNTQRALYILETREVSDPRCLSTSKNPTAERAAALLPFEPPSQSHLHSAAATAHKVCLAKAGEATRRKQTGGPRPTYPVSQTSPNARFAARPQSCPVSTPTSAPPPLRYTGA